MANVGIYGGSFDPPHLAHSAAIATALKLGAVDAVWVFPTARHAFGKDLSGFADRVRMCELAFAAFGALVRVKTDEATLVAAGGAGTTIELLEHLCGLQKARFRLLIGTDQLAALHRWARVDELLTLAEPLVLGRPGWPDRQGPGGVADRWCAIAELPNISSTMVRERVARGHDVHDLIDPEVAAYIATRRLYGNA